MSELNITEPIWMWIFNKLILVIQHTEKNRHVWWSLLIHGVIETVLPLGCRRNGLIKGLQMLCCSLWNMIEQTVFLETQSAHASLCFTDMFLKLLRNVYMPLISISGIITVPGDKSHVLVLTSAILSLSLTVVSENIFPVQNSVATLS